MRKQHTVYQVPWASVGLVGVARRQAALISPYGPVTTPERWWGGKRGVPLLFSLIYDRPLWHALDHYHCGKDRKKVQGGCVCVCVCVCLYV